VILGYLKGKAFQLSADDILYLKSQGVSQAVIAAMVQSGAAGLPANGAPAPTALPVAPVLPAPPPVMPGPAPVAAPVAVAAAPAPEVTYQYFHDQLAPFGTWIDIDGVLYWQPNRVIAANPDWRPYYDMGHWVQTDNGLFWQSDYTWGDIPFHYGRWVLDPGRGWLWAPDYTWGPAWVAWRHAEADGAIGWAPLPVGTVFIDGAVRYHGVVVAADFDFGLGDGCFVFVGYDHFHDGFFRMRGREYAFHMPHDRVRAFYGRSVIHNEFRRDEHGRFVNEGIGRERMEHLTPHVERANFEERHPVGDFDKARGPEAAHGPAGGEHPGAAPASKVFRPPAQAGPGGPAKK
jgi:hypothetical protein